MDYKANCHKSLQLRNKIEFYNRSLNPTEVLNLSIYTCEVSNKFLPIREAWPLIQENWFLSFSLAPLSSSLQSDGCLHSYLVKECSNGGIVNEEDLPPIITFPCPILVLPRSFP